MKVWMLLYYFFSQSIFFITLSLFSIEHNENSPAYMIYRIILASLIIVLTGIIGFIGLRKNSYIVKKNKVYLLTFGLLILLAAISSYLFYNQSSIIYQLLTYLFGLSLPAILLVLIINEKHIQSFYLKLKYLNYYIIICLMLGFLSKGISDFSTLGGGNHLMIGYTLAILFPFNLQQVIFSKTMRGKTLYLLITLISACLILISGSRGAFLTILIIFVIQYFMYVLKRHKFLLSLIPLSIVSYIIYFLIKGEHLLLNNFERILLIFNSDISVATSNRDSIYESAIAGYLESPIFGNGLGSYGVSQNRYIFPHNFLLEILHDFGMIGLFFVILLLIIYMIKLINIFRTNQLAFHLIGFLFIVSFISLLFSGTYLTNLYFIISASLIFTLVPTDFKVFKYNLQKIEG